MASPALALPAAGGVRPRRVLTMAVLFVSAAGTMLFGTLIAAYLHLRRLAHPFPPAEAEIDQYWGNLVLITMLLGVATVEWACYALRREERNQSLAGLGITVGLGLASLNLISFGASQVEFDAVSHPYGLVVTAMTMLLGIVIGAAVAFASLTLFRVAGGQRLGVELDQLRATAVFWHFTVAATVAVWYTVIVLK